MLSFESESDDELDELSLEELLDESLPLEELLDESLPL